MNIDKILLGYSIAMLCACSNMGNYGNHVVKSPHTDTKNMSIEEIRNSGNVNQINIHNNNVMPNYSVYPNNASSNNQSNTVNTTTWKLY